MDKITLQEQLTIVALVVGPIAALLIQRVLDRFRSQEARRRFVFKELMATRGELARTSARHVDALNAIEVEFAGRKRYKKVLDAWRLYLTNLNTRFTEDTAAQWGGKNDDLLTELLFEMAGTLNYDFNKATLKTNIYTPRAHGDLEMEMRLLRQRLFELLDGKRTIWVSVLPAKDSPLQVQRVGEKPTNPDPFDPHAAL